MREFFYPDTCKIEYATGTINSQGEEVFDKVYEGDCGLQFPGGGSTSLKSGLLQASPTLYLPVGGLLLAQNSRIEITMSNGRVLIGDLEQYESDNYDEDLAGTVIWLKTVTDKTT